MKNNWIKSTKSYNFMILRVSDRIKEQYDNKPTNQPLVENVKKVTLVFCSPINWPDYETIFNKNSIKKYISIWTTLFQ